MSRLGEADRMRCDRREQPRRATRERDNGAPGRRLCAFPVCSGVSHADLSSLAGAAQAHARPGLPRPRPLAGAGPGAAQRRRLDPARAHRHLRHRAGRPNLRQRTRPGRGVHGDQRCLGGGAYPRARPRAGGPPRWPVGHTTCGMQRYSCGSTPESRPPRSLTDGHSVQVLLRVYAKCLDDGEAVANKRIDAALLVA